MCKTSRLRESRSIGKLIKNVEIKIGQLTILWDVCATKLTDTVLLGLDLLSAQIGLVDFKNLVITFGQETLRAEMSGTKYYHIPKLNEVGSSRTRNSD